ncbi:hypothetical protein Tco_1273649 [Tanacetum coccineum]
MQKYILKQQFEDSLYPTQMVIPPGYERVRTHIEDDENFAFMASNSSGSDTQKVQPKVWSDAPIIEEYESDSDDENVTVQTKRLDTPSFANKQVKTPRENVKSQSTHKIIPHRTLKNKELLIVDVPGTLTGKHRLYLLTFKPLKGGPDAFERIEEDRNLLKVEDDENLKLRRNQTSLESGEEEIKRLTEDFIAIGSIEDESLIKKMKKKDSSKGEEIKQESKEEVKQVDKEEENTRKRKQGTRKKMKSRKRRFKQDSSQDDPSDTEKENDELKIGLDNSFQMMIIAHLN